MLLRLFLLALLACLVAAHSKARNPIHVLRHIENTSILTGTGRVNALSRFDLTFDVFHGDSTIKLSLEPNHDVIPEGAHVNYVRADGSIRHSEPIDRLDHKVFKGVARRQLGDKTWASVGWARVTVVRDGKNPLFEGVFSVHGDHHHVQLGSTYRRTKHELDPLLDSADDDEDIVFWRDSDVKEDSKDENLKKRVTRELGCEADKLEFNKRPDHPVYTGVRRKVTNNFGRMSYGSLFGKRQQFDTQGGGNTAGVDLSTTIGNPNGCPSTRKVALVGIVTDCTYTQQFENEGQARRSVIQTMSMASDVWERTFNITLGLKNLTVFDAVCPGQPQTDTPFNQDCAADLDISARLSLFSEWRGQFEDGNSHWTLMTNCNSGSAVGLAWLGQACRQGSSTSNLSGGGSETEAGANIVALTSTEWQVIAHETGHTFGAVHDCTSDTCSDGFTVESQQCCPLTSDPSSCDAGEQYLMNPFQTRGIRNFSPCTLGNVCSGLLQGTIDSTCLRDNTGVVTITGQQCGNGIVEEGEDCDCGGDESCLDDACCDPTTCRYSPGSVCDDANEDCCSGCQFKSNGTVCRPSTSSCDPEEFCTGDHGLCPTDETAEDGRSCIDSQTNEDGLTCASGQCTSRNYQCQSVMSDYTSNPNDTHACDDTSCVLSCASPAFPDNTCYGLQQNLIDGTPCGGGGQCRNGQCQGSDFGEEVLDWIQEHKGIVIGVSVALGVIFLLIVFSCITGCIRRRRARKRAAAAKLAAMQQQGQGPPGPWIGPRAPDGTWYGPQSPPPQFSPFPPPVPPHREFSSSAPPEMTQQQQQRATSPPPPFSPPPPPPTHAAADGWRPPPVQPPRYPGAGLYGQGIIGGRSPVSPASPTSPGGIFGGPPGNARSPQMHGAATGGPPIPSPTAPPRAWSPTSPGSTRWG